MGIAGGIFIVASMFLFAIQTGSPWAIALYIVMISVALVLLVKFAIWRIRTAKPQRSIYSNASQDGYQAVSYDASAIGKKESFSPTSSREDSS